MIWLLACTRTLEPPATEGPSQRYSHVGCLDEAGDSLLIVGGSSEQGRRMDAWRFDLADRSWEQLPDPPESLFRSTLVRLGGEAYVFGGTASGGTENDRHWLWDLDSGAWTQLEGGPVGRYKGAAAQASSDAWLLHGGRNDDSGEDETLEDLWLYDGAWTELEVEGGPGPRTRQALAWDGATTIWLQGGIDHTDTRHEDVWSFDLESSTWTEHPAATEGPGVRASHTMVFHEGELIVWAGHGDEDTVWSFDVATSSWSRLAEGGPAGRDAQVTDLRDGVITIMGGDPADDENLPHFVNDVWQFDIASATWEELWAIE